MVFPDADFSSPGHLGPPLSRIHRGGAPSNPLQFAARPSDHISMRRTLSLLARVGLASLAASMLMLQGNPMWAEAIQSAPTEHARASLLRRLVIPEGIEVVSDAERTAKPLQQMAPPRPRRPAPSLLVSLMHDLRATSRPGGGHVVGYVPAGSKYYRIPTVAWVLQVSANGRFGRVPIPYTTRPRTGWISLKGLRRLHTPYVVYADLSRHLITVRKLGRIVLRTRAATGAPRSPTPSGRYFVTDRVAFNPRGPLGAFAFGISGIQTRLPPGWRGGNQLAIHGTNNPGSIGRSASAGCLRVSRAALERLKRILILGTPVIIQP
jgi:lipoprotein-anchoring transpeptidase ErfK/SrfK